MNWTAKERRILADAMSKEMKPTQHIFPTQLSNAEYEAFKLAERQHAPGVTCRMNPRTFRVEYYNEETGELVK